VVDARLASIYATADDELADRLIDGVALEAANGSPYALQLLLNLITRHRLAHPAISRHLNGSAAQDDAHQEVLIAVTRSIHRYRGESKFTTWLYSLARNTAVAEVRRAKPVATYDEQEAETGGMRFTSRAADRQILQVAISQLPSIFRDIVYLRDIERMSYDDIALREGIALNTVRSRLSRGRALLATQLGSFRQL
jgi:RNA polymerase sigma-70 factor (ECF subfamily)